MEEKNEFTINEKVKHAIEEYQCSGCLFGYDTTCFGNNSIAGIGCGKHRAATMIGGIGKIYIGMPKGFNRLGAFENKQPYIFENIESADWEYDMWNIPVWKYLSKEGHTFVRGIMPRRNEPFIHIYLEDCLDKINCLEILQKDIDYMD